MSEKEAKEAMQERNDARTAMMNDIADNSEKHREHEEQLEVTDDAAEAEARAAAEDAEAQRLQAEGIKTEVIAPESDEKIINGVTHYLQVVNGQERWQTMKEIRDAAQKVDSADDYLRQASESVKNAARVALSQKDVPARLGKDEYRELLRRQALGEEEAIEKLASLYEQSSSPPEDITHKIDQRLSFRTELAELQAANKDLLDDPYLGELFSARLDRMKREAPSTSLAEAYGKIGKELRDRFGATLKNGTQEKLERKRTLVNPPSAAARQPIADEPDGDEESGYRDAISEMAKSRLPRPNLNSQRRQ